jgi:CRISPR-associated endonuclease Cas2
MERKLKYKGVTVNTFGLPIMYSDKKEGKSEVRHGELHKSDSKYHHYHYFNSTFTETAPKDLIVMYDIPHEKKKERDWFRRHLKKFNYTMIQKSVWVGPSPLPKDFLDYVKSINLIDQLKTFKLAKSYTKEESAYKNAL